MAENNSNRKGQEGVRVAVEVSQDFIELCCRYRTTPEAVISGFVKDITLDDVAPYDPYKVLSNQAARKYIEAAHGITRIINNGKYTERPSQITIN